MGLVAVLSLGGCGSNTQQDQLADAQRQEVERLRQENQGLTQARTDNEQVQKLRKENEELAKLRSQYQEAVRLRKENEQLRQQVAKISPNAGQGSAAAGGATSQAATATPEKEKAKGAPEEDLALNDGDDVMVDPKTLKTLLPDIDWDKLKRTEPIGVRALLEKDGFVITNTSQLREYGITNFVIRHQLPPPQPTAEAQAEPAAK
jgi:hypothetical protein